MVDKEPEAYRPRRALPPPTTPPDATNDEAPKPLYRDEVAGSSPTGPSEPTVRLLTGENETTLRRSVAPSGSSAAPRTASEETQILSRARARTQAAASGRPTRRRQPDEDATTLLPRTAGGDRVQRRGDDFADEPDHRFGSRSRTALLVGAVAAVVVLGLAVLYTVINLTKESAAPGTTTPSPAGPSATSTSASPSPSPSESGSAAILTDATMISAQAASGIDSGRKWKVALTQKGRTSDSPQPACLGGDPVEGQPTAQQTMLRLVSSNGKKAPALMHEADAYRSPEEAAQAYAMASKSLGGCAMQAAYIFAGKSVSGVGDQAVGLVVDVTDGKTPQYHSVVLARTGRVVNVVDVAQPEQDVPVGRVADALAEAVKAQCDGAGGSCDAKPGVKNGPPPLGGDQPGFLATGDLPPVGKDLTGWVGDTPGKPAADQVKGSGCETVNWATVDATSRAARTYLLADSSSPFGLDQVVITTAKDSDAKNLVDKVKGDWVSCPRRQLTATVPGTRSVKGIGAQKAQIKGWTATVSQKSAGSTARYRVGVVSVGSKVVYTFLNPQDTLDLTDDQFDAVTVRAGQRATQVK